MAFYLPETLLPLLGSDLDCSIELFLSEKREVAGGVESAVGGRQPAYQEVIDTELLDDCFLVTLAEDVAVDHPGSRSAADRTVDDVHGLSLKDEGDAVCVPLTCLWISDLD
jgi:hypothetical protein